MSPKRIKQMTLGIQTATLGSQTATLANTYQTCKETKDTWNRANNCDSTPIMQTNLHTTHIKNNQLNSNTWQTTREQQNRCTWPSTKWRKPATHNPTKDPTNYSLAHHKRVTVAEQPIKQLKPSHIASFTSQKSIGYTPSQADTIHKKNNQIFI